MKTTELKDRLKSALPEGDFYVKDLTGTEDHFQVVAISQAFQGLSLLEQHRMVYAPLEKDIQGAIHALSIKTFTQDQWKSSPVRQEVEHGNNYS